MEDINVKINAAKVATQNPPTAMPGTRIPVILSINPLITKVNKPILRILIGKVRMRSTGRTKALIMLNTAAPIIKEAMVSK